MRTGTGTNNSNVRTPHGFSFSEITITNYAGEQLDIASLVKDVVINESLLAQSLVMEMTIVDSSNLFEFHKISGNEKVLMKFIRTVPREGSADPSISKDVQEFVLDLRVSDIPIFTRPKPNVQVYRIQCISEHAYVGTGTRISKSVNGTAGQIMKDIAENYMGAAVTKMDSTIGTMHAIVPNLRANDAVNWIQKVAYDSYSSPVYFFETLLDGLQIRGHTNLLDEEDLPTLYKHQSLFSADIDSTSDYFERKSRILNISSAVGLSKLAGISRGAWGSTTIHIDPFNKVFEQVMHEDERERRHQLEPHKLTSDQYQLANKTVNDLSKSTVISSVNIKEAFDAGVTYNELIPSFAPKKKIILQNMESISHVVKLHGDPELRPGRKINIQLPISTDPALDNLEQIADSKFDQYVSGRYMIVSAIHQFDEKGGYFTEIKIKRDSSPKELS